VQKLAGLPDTVFAEVGAKIRVTAGAKTLIDAVHAAGGRVGAVSGGFSQVLNPLADLLSLDFARANELEVVDGVLTGKVIGKIVDRTAKKEALLEWAGLADFQISQTIAVGDGANDLEMMEVAGLSVAFNAKPIVKERASLVLDSGNLADLIPMLGL
jgi:phosphoserine phosphatase